MDPKHCFQNRICIKIKWILSIVFRIGSPLKLNGSNKHCFPECYFVQNEEDCNLACPVCLELLKPPLRFVKPFPKFQDIIFFIYLLFRKLNRQYYYILLKVENHIIIYSRYELYNVKLLSALEF